MLQQYFCAAVAVAVALFATGAFGDASPTVSLVKVEPHSYSDSNLDSRFTITIDFHNPTSNSVYLKLGTCATAEKSISQPLAQDGTTTSLGSSDYEFTGTIDETSLKNCGFTYNNTDGGQQTQLSGYFDIAFRTPNKRQIIVSGTLTLVRDLTATSSLSVDIKYTTGTDGSDPNNGGTVRNDLLVETVIPSKLRVCGDESSLLVTTQGSEICLRQTFDSPVIDHLHVAGTDMHPYLEGYAVNATRKTLAAAMKTADMNTATGKRLSNGTRYADIWVTLDQTTCTSATCKITMLTKLTYVAASRRRDVNGSALVPGTYGTASSLQSIIIPRPGGNDGQTYYVDSGSSNDNAIAIGVGVGVGVAVGGVIIAAVVWRRRKSEKEAKKNEQHV